MEEAIKNIILSIINILEISPEEFNQNTERYLKIYLNKIEFNHYDCKQIDKEIEKIQRDIRILEARAEYQSPQFGEKVDTSLNTRESRIEIAMMQTEEMKEELKNMVVEKYLILKSLEQQTSDIIKLFELTIPNEMHRRILKAIYIDCEKPQKLEERLFLAYATIRSIVCRSIKKMAVKLKCIKMQQ